MHISICQGDSQIPLTRCTTCCTLFHCPLCPKFKPTTLSRIQRHLDVHSKNALLFKDKKICRCNLACRTAGHYHCPQCDKTVVRRLDMDSHLLLCQRASAAQSEEEASGAEGASPLPSASSGKPAPSPPPLQPAPPPLWSAPSTLQSAPPPLQSAPSKFPLQRAPSPLTTIKPTDMQQPLKTVTCPHCTVILLRKNLAPHILRKHTDRAQDITMASHLASVCVDAANGICAVKKTGHGFSAPVHVQKKTWGEEHRVRCELEECRRYHLLAPLSGPNFRLCEHIRSLDYCDRTAAQELLQARVLEGMVELEFFGEVEKATCLRRQVAAQEAHAPFSVLVEFGASPKQVYISIHEPTIDHFSRLGRVMVTYDSTGDTWRCPCAKPGMSCPHKNIGKWHLFQSNRDLLRTKTQSSDPDLSRQAPARAFRFGPPLPWEPVMMVHLRQATHWVLQHEDEFSAPVLLPRVLTMEEGDVAVALQQYVHSSSSVCAEEDREEILAPFIFVFQTVEDMTVFQEKVVERQGLTAYCRVDD